MNIICVLAINLIFCAFVKKMFVCCAQELAVRRCNEAGRWAQKPKPVVKDELGNAEINETLSSDPDKVRKIPVVDEGRGWTDYSRCLHDPQDTDDLSLMKVRETLYHYQQYFDYICNYFY